MTRTKNKKRRKTIPRKQTFQKFKNLGMKDNESEGNVMSSFC